MPVTLGLAKRVMSAVILVAAAGWMVGALWAPALAEAPAAAQPEQQAPPAGAAPQAPQALPEAWTRLGEIFMQLVDARIELQVEQRVDAMIQRRLQEPLTALEQRLVSTTQQLSETTTTLTQRLEQSIGDFRLALDDQNSRITALEAQAAELRSQLSAKDAEVERLRADVRGLQTRFWIAVGAGVVGILVGLLVR